MHSATSTRYCNASEKMLEINSQEVFTKKGRTDVAERKPPDKLSDSARPVTKSLQSSDDAKTLKQGKVVPKAVDRASSGLNSGQAVANSEAGQAVQQGSLGGIGNFRLPNPTANISASSSAGKGQLQANHVKGAVPDGGNGTAMGARAKGRENSNLDTSASLRGEGLGDLAAVAPFVMSIVPANVVGSNNNDDVLVADSDNDSDRDTDMASSDASKKHPTKRTRTQRSPDKAVATDAAKKHDGGCGGGDGVEPSVLSSSVLPSSVLASSVLLSNHGAATGIAGRGGRGGDLGGGGGPAGGRGGGRGRGQQLPAKAKQGLSNAFHSVSLSPAPTHQFR